MGDEGHYERIGSLLEEGLGLARELSMKPVEKTITEAVGELGKKKNRQRPAGLTKREMEVLALLVQGKTNQEISVELFISEYTMANHVSSIFSKTKTSNRAEAAVVANRSRMFEK